MQHQGNGCLCGEDSRHFGNFFYIYHHSSHALSIMPKSVDNVLMLCKPKSSSFHIQRMYVRFHDKLKDNKVDINVMSYYKVNMYLGSIAKHIQHSDNCQYVLHQMIQTEKCYGNFLFLTTNDYWLV